MTKRVAQISKGEEIYKEGLKAREREREIIINRIQESIKGQKLKLDYEMERRLVSDLLVALKGSTQSLAGDEGLTITLISNLHVGG